MRRRDFLVRSATIGCAALSSASVRTRVEAFTATGESRTSAMLLGSLIGDALGGPVEFLPGSQTASILTNARGWAKDRMLDAGELSRLSETLRMESYQELRPETAAYGPWQREAQAGTITDDSRHKIILLRALRKMVAEDREYLTQDDLAREFVAFTPHEGVQPEGHLAELLEEGLREYCLASRWLLGDRNIDRALPVERLWAGVSNCSGQMAFLPLAALFPGSPDEAYRETFRLDFIDAPIARDIVAALNAGLSVALDPAADRLTEEDRWKLVLRTIRETDPYRFRDVPFAGRQLDRWLDLSDSINERSGGRPAEAYRLLETEGKPLYYWDAHFTLLVPLTLLKLCNFDPLAAMHLTLDFGHDTDSYAQILGALAGAVHGMDIWKDRIAQPVRARLLSDYGESVASWTTTLQASAKLWSAPKT